MIKLSEKVTHDGKTYDPGNIIEKINNQQAQRLVNLGVAFFVGKIENSEPSEDPEKEDQASPEDLQHLNAKEELESIDYFDLKSIAKEVELEFSGNISKADLIGLIVENQKVDEVLALTEEEE
ncbi:DUF7210 family protein [Lentibacillus sp. Marseille-P4043]|uniref:DUF7210 family protein n=1 Tax=Lentibacillus sp. Marseille-P4043 TaxID=2040293 RepID=UPI000D0B3FE6|nr:hypothetical protein [Lentibacillus sp. Marseille-P4043]